LRQPINEGRDVQSIIDSRRREREVAETEGTETTIFQRSPHGSAVTSTLRASSRLGSPSMMARKLLSNGYIVTPPPLKSQGAPTSPRSSTSRWLWTLRRSCGWRASATTRSTPGSSSRKSSSTTSRGRLPM
jgi:hypothetical protein